MSELNYRLQVGLRGLHVLTETMEGKSHVELAALALAGGSRVIQYRRKLGSTRLMVEEAAEILKLCLTHQALLIINDRLDVALAAGAHGVHLGREDLPWETARQYLGKDKILGCSAAAPEHAAAARAAGADYVGYGPVFSTVSKNDAGQVKGLSGLKDFCQAAGLPVVAIGGIGLENINQVMAAGAHACAVISAVCRRQDPRRATELLVRAVNGAGGQTAAGCRE
ncbi:MAG: thiamine phosphate synthase [Desulfarculales bacterium]|jgi:thiamine-phosphate pyrophosphorylase|nr:thiamine phosphate synthase [Desulfarculales bacterium]